MKNFLDQLVTNLRLTVLINGTVVEHKLLDHLNFDINSVVTIDNIEILPRYHYLAVDGVLSINEPFYCWYHKVSDQGWLLKPY